MKTPKRPLIAVDVDLTIVDTLTPWFNWIRQITGEEFPVMDYCGTPGLGKHLPQWMKNYDDLPGFLAEYNGPTVKTDKDAITAYWKQRNLYQNLKPIEGAQEYLSELSRKADIVFVTHCFPGHIDSKRRFLDSQFRFKHDFIDTKAKHLIAYDVLIDDNYAVISNGLKNRPRAHNIFFKQVFSAVALGPSGWDSEDVDKAIAMHMPGASIAYSWNDVRNGLQGLDIL